MTFLDLFNAEVAIERDIRYRDTDHPRHVLDVYAPTGYASTGYAPTVKNGLPIALWFYGGGWRSGDKRLFEHLGRAFALRGIVLVAVNYRLSPEVTFPQNAEDCAAAVRWTYDHAEEYGGDPEKIFLTGHSAGAHLAAITTLDRRFLDGLGLPAHIVRGCVMISGATDLAGHVGSTQFTSREHVEETFGASTEELRVASPVTYVRSDAPPFLIMVAERDPEGLKEQGKLLADELREADAESRYIVIKGHDHFSIVRRFGPSEDTTANAAAEFINYHAGAGAD